MAGTLSILCVEDDEDILVITAISLRLDRAITVLTARNAEEAMLILRDPAVSVDCVLLDVQIPRTDGIALLAMLRELARHRHTPVIFLTARAREAEVIRYTSLNVAGVIAKPYNPLTLTQTVRDMLAHTE